MTTIIFFEVKDNATKLQKICSAIQQHFNDKERILVSVPSPEAANFIDQLLWRSPEESFLPHVIAHEKTEEFIAISANSLNVNQAKIVFNLKNEIPSSPTDFNIIYEFMDLTLPEKQIRSQERLALYQTMKYKIIFNN